MPAYTASLAERDRRDRLDLIRQGQDLKRANVGAGTDWSEAACGFDISRTKSGFCILSYPIPKVVFFEKSALLLALGEKPTYGFFVAIDSFLSRDENTSPR